MYELVVGVKQPTEPVFARTGQRSLIEFSSTQGQDGIQAIRSPSHASLLETSGDDSLAGRFGDAAAHVHALRTKSGVARASGIGGKVAKGLLWNAFALAWGGATEAAPRSG